MIGSDSLGACQGLWEPGEEECTWLELHHAGMVNGLFVSTLVLVTWEVTRLLVSVTTWIRGVCQHIDTTRKKSGCLLIPIYIQAFTFLLYFHVLDIRDHSLALPCLG